MRSFRAQLTQLVRTAAEFRDVAGPVWGPRVGAYVCAAHHLEHHLREAHGAQLLLTGATAANRSNCMRRIVAWSTSSDGIRVAPCQ